MKIKDTFVWMRIGLIAVMAIVLSTLTIRAYGVLIVCGMLWIDYLVRLVIMGATSKREVALTTTIEQVRSVLESERVLSASRFDLITDLKRDLFNVRAAKGYAERRLSDAERDLAFERTKFAEFQRSCLNEKIMPIEKFVIDAKGKKISLTGSGRRR